MFVVIIAVMSIMMGVAVQTASFQMQREREAELIFRGQQYVEAIRLYKQKYGRYPMQLKELYEAKPRVIRKKWKDPITDSHNWGIVFLGQDGQQLGRGRVPGSITDAGGRPIGTQPPFGGSPQEEEGLSLDDDAAEPGAESGEPGAFGGAAANRKVGPIIGVHSTACDEAIKVYEGRTTYCEWRFIYREEQPRPGQRGQRSGGVHGGDWLTTPVPGQPGQGSEKPPPGGPPGPIQTPNP
ncbi:MAG TPA: hypothetical protein VLB51_11100 [Methylomirabilota bacterium]|nr:hypothetical protein [Methylomirabilota bacterium]